MEKAEFEAIVWQAIDALPPHIQRALHNVIIVIEDRPTGRRRGLLLGLYEGIPLTSWGRSQSGDLPDKITIFREPIEMVAESEADIPRVIRETVWHEVGHYFGLDHEHIGRMEKRWHEDRKQS